MADRYEDLRTFVAVVDAHGFGVAADRLGVVKSAVSRRIRELEDRLGAQLLQRSTRSISLTGPGQEFYERAVRILADLHEAEAIASAARTEPTGALRVAAPMSFGVLHLAPVIGEFLDRHRQMRVDLDLNDRFVDLINEGFDLAIRISRLKDSSLVARPIATIRHAVCASPDYLRRHGTPATPEDLAGHRGLAYSNLDERTYWSFIQPDTGKAFSVEVASVLRVNNGGALRESAIAGHGVAYLPTFIIAPAVERGELVPLLQPFQRPPLELSAVYPSRRNVPAKVRAFIAFLADRFGEAPYWDAIVDAAAGP
ncbi:LysR family transcriptional regulator [Tahibacter amnicola]|uniref:LysR family transcriptional regulator n=1 Tax=Tahibacter amnicola TaxID=2976241 RepID=A0ABY6BIE6_9GAMM|nr:LysR family transcriptional regulator [Tahibacter amnicola]UXI69786.1 LysR family transcriptional regulator [Tahibacter amnicola]